MIIDKDTYCIIEDEGNVSFSIAKNEAILLYDKSNIVNVLSANDSKKITTVDKSELNNLTNSIFI